MLLKKLFSNTDYKGKRIIGLLGVNRGAGLTYTGMLLSSYFGTEKRIKTAYLECNNHLDFERLQKVYEWSKEDEKSFTFDLITYYKEVKANDVSEILSDDYGCYIFDFGTDFISWKEEFLRCGTKVIIGDQAIWNQCKVVAFLKSLDNFRGSKEWLYMIPCANKRVLMRMANKTDRSFLSIPYEADPTLISKETHRLFQGLFG